MELKIVVFGLVAAAAVVTEEGGRVEEVEVEEVVTVEGGAARMANRWGG